MRKSVYINTLGCAKNEVDSNKMANKLRSAGYVITDDPSQAHLIIVNTCSFIEAATQESIDTTLDYLNLKDNRDVAIVVSGCMPSRYSSELESQLPEVDAFLPCNNEDGVVEIVSSLIGPSDLTSNERNLNNRLVSSYVKISEGCDRACSFCTIPKIRGHYHSHAYDQIVKDVEEAVSSGAVEINFVAQDTGHWGRDFDEPSTLSELLGKIAIKFPKTYFRVLYVQPDEVTDALLHTIKTHDNIVNYLDMPLQHVSAHVLKSMNRTGNASDFKKRIEHIKSILPSVTLRTTFMVGFPGESDEDFQDLLDFASLGFFDFVGVFAYSNEDDAKSHTFVNQVDEEEKKYRLRELTDLVDSISSAKIRSKIGNVEQVIVEGVEEDGQIFGRCLFQAPEVDGVTYLDKGCVGDVVKAKIDDTLMYDLEGEVL